jgi:hypothetical protein
MASPYARVPRLIAGVELTKLPLSPLEGFIMSRIDGTASISVLADLTNLLDVQVEQVVLKLIDVGAAEWAIESVSLPRPTGRPARRTPTGVITVPENLKVPRPGAVQGNTRARLRITKPSSGALPAVGAYSTQSPGQDVVDPARRSGRPTEARTSHTGSIFPPGELDDMEALVADIEEDLGTAQTLPPPPSVPRSGSFPPAIEADLEAQTEADPRAQPDARAEAAAQAAADARAEAQAEADARAEAEARAEADAKAADAAAAAQALEAALVQAEAEARAEEDAERERAEAEVRAFEQPPAAEEELDLPPERRQRIDNLYFALDLLDHYEVLGIGRDADRKEVRAAYFGLSKVFHPDTMFRKRLGGYKAKMESIFNRLTEAYEVLGKKRSRHDYDRYLQLQDRTRAVEAAIDPAAVDAEELGRRGRTAALLEATIAAGKELTDVASEPPATTSTAAA